jgi:hypothetical protein
MFLSAWVYPVGRFLWHLPVFLLSQPGSSRLLYPDIPEPAAPTGNTSLLSGLYHIKGSFASEPHGEAIAMSVISYADPRGASSACGAD